TAWLSKHLMKIQAVDRSGDCSDPGIYGKYNVFYISN
ncbi:hypothetical protein CCACVL1_18598, partial [Corchorus capsularis]